MRAALALIGLLAVAAPAADEPPALTDLLVQVGRYVRGFQADFATVIGDETYRQRVHLLETIGGSDQTSRAARTMLSEMLFLWVPEDRGWLTVRNVLRVDGAAVPDSHGRLERTLADPAPGMVSRIRRLRDENARFNIGRIQHNFSDPALALQFVDPPVQPRFNFTLRGREIINGLVTWPIAFSERAAPTMITVDGRHALSTGMIWVTSSGIVVRTRLALADPTSYFRLGMVVSFGHDVKLGAWVPVRMEETYSQSRNGGAVSEEIACSATYSNFRRFETSARIVPPQ
jgi:hypothetical protein